MIKYILEVLIKYRYFEETRNSLNDYHFLNNVPRVL